MTISPCQAARHPSETLRSIEEEHASARNSMWHRLFNPTSLSLLWRGCSRKSRLSAQEDKTHGNTSSQNQQSTSKKRSLPQHLENQGRHCDRETDVFGVNERCCSGSQKLESYCFVSLSSEFEVAPSLHTQHLSPVWRGCPTKSRLSTQ